MPRLKIKSNDMIKFLFFILLLITCFQNISIITFVDRFSFKMSHLCSMIFLPLLIKKNKIKLPPILLTIFLVYVIGLSFFMIPKYGFNSLLLNYIFSLYYLIIITSPGDKISLNEWKSIIKKVAWIVVIATLIKLALNINILIQFFSNPYGHPMIDTFFGGGVNLEATWIGLLGFFFSNDRKGYLYSIFSLVVSILYASRVGIIVSSILLIYLIFQRNENKLNKKNIIKIFYMLIFVIFGIFIIYKLGYLDYMLSRFLNAGKDTGSTMRLTMWGYALKAFFNNPIGYGLGNCINALENVAYVIFTDKNMHNLFLQMLVDTGIIGFLLYLFVIFFFVKNEYKNFFKNSFVAFIFTYLLLSFIQFRGGDAIFYFMVAIYINNRVILKKDKGE